MGGSGRAVEYVYYYKQEYKALSSDQISAFYKKMQVMVHKPAEKKVMSKGGGATEELMKQISGLVDVMTSALEAQITDPPIINRKNRAFTRQRTLRK